MEPIQEKKETSIISKCGCCGLKKSKFLTSNKISCSIQKKSKTSSNNNQANNFLMKKIEELENELGFNKDTKTNLTVTYSEGDNYGVTYSKFVPFLVKAVQELSAQVTTLQQELKTIKGE